MGEGNKMFSMAFGLKACLHSAKSSFGKKANAEKKNENKLCRVILSCSPKAGRPGACLYAHKRVRVSQPAGGQGEHLQPQERCQGLWCRKPHVGGPIPTLAHPIPCLSQLTGNREVEGFHLLLSSTQPSSGQRPFSPQITSPFSLPSKAEGIVSNSSVPGTQEVLGPLSSKKVTA